MIKIITRLTVTSPLSTVNSPPTAIYTTGLIMVSFFMIQKLEDSTLWKLLLLLKKHGEMSIEEMSNALNITPIGVRQHVLNLERDGFISYQLRRKGVGRPGFIYSLTKKAEELFPNNYKNLVLEILREIEEEDGRKKIDHLFKKRKEKLLREKRSLLDSAKNLKTRLSLFVESLKSDGYIVEIKEKGEEFELLQYNCPISIVSHYYKEACRYELELYKELFSEDVKRTNCASEGGNFCSYIIPKEALQAGRISPTVTSRPTVTSSPTVTSPLSKD